MSWGFTNVKVAVEFDAELHTRSDGSRCLVVRDGPLQPGREVTVRSLELGGLTSVLLGDAVGTSYSIEVVGDPAAAPIHPVLGDPAGPAVPAEGEVHVSAMRGGGSLVARLVELGPSGLAMVSRRSLELGQQLAAAVALRPRHGAWHDLVVHVVARVTASRPTPDDDLVRSDLRFTAVTAGDLVRLRTWLEERRAAGPERRRPVGA